MSKEHVRLAVVGIVIVLWATSLFALTPQTVWTRTYGGTSADAGTSVQQTSDGGYIITGLTWSFGAGGEDVYLIKTDASGDTVWTRTYGGTGNEGGVSVEQTSDGGYIIAGWAFAPGAAWADVYLIKTDAGGDTVWTRTYGGADADIARSVQQTSDSGYIAVGETRSFSADSIDVYLIKTDAGGDTVWTRMYGGAGHEGGTSVQQTSDGGYIIAGYTSSFGAGQNDVYLIKTDTSGDTVWTRTYGWTGWEDGYSVRETSDGGYIIAGVTNSFGAGGSDVYLIKTDASGDTVWTRVFGGTISDDAMSVHQTSDGGYITAGTTWSFGAGSSDIYVIRTDESGNLGWKRTYGGAIGESGECVQQTADGAFIIAGATGSFGAGLSDVYLIKVREHKWTAKDVKFGGPPAPGRGDEETVVAFSNEMSTRLALHGNAPNPFSEGTVIRFDLPEQGEVNLSIHDIQGRLVKELVSEVRPPGSHSVVWDGRDFFGAELSAGIYFVRLRSGGKIAAGKVVAR
jgi:hypothetical protein